MAKYKVLNPIAYGGRRERGEIVEMTDVMAKSIGSDFLEKYEGEQGPVALAEEEKPLAKMTVAELRKQAESMGLETDGTKADLIERIELSQDEE